MSTIPNFHAIISPRMTSVLQITDTSPFAGIKKYFEQERMLSAIERRQQNMMFSPYDEVRWQQSFGTEEDLE